jgi:UDP-GlcNAc:undecaprenyl-phosphate GlcNAc-1-phosphate transferase
MVLGLVDDVRKLDWRFRLAVQTVVAAAVVFGRGWTLTLFIDAPALTGVLSVLWIVGLVNSFNMLDNMDGLAGGVAVIAAALLAIVMLMVPEASQQPQLFVAGFLFLLVGALVGFLFHNRPPARLFMGDAGSYFVGFCLAVMTILATFTGHGLPRHSILIPLCIFAVPLYDTVSVVCIRLRAGASVFEGDTNHFSHRLVALGLTKGQAVLTIYLTTAACGLGALVLPQVNVAGAVTVALVIACLLSVIAILETTARRKMRP